MEPMPEGYDQWKTTSPKEDVFDDDEVRRLERTASDCPFMHESELQRPYFQETEEGWFMTCECGVNLGPKETPQEAISSWNSRICKSPGLYREGFRTCWTGG